MQIENIINEFDAKFFIAGTNALGEEKPLLFPAKVEVRDWLRTTLTAQKQSTLEQIKGIVEEMKPYTVREAHYLMKHPYRGGKQLTEETITEYINKADLLNRITSEDKGE